MCFIYAWFINTVIIAAVTVLEVLGSHGIHIGHQAIIIKPHMIYFTICNVRENVVYAVLYTISAHTVLPRSNNR